MAYSRVTKIGDGVSTQFTVNFALDYIEQDHVTARVGTEVDGLGAPVYRPITFLSKNLLQVGGTVPALGQKIVFERTVPKDNLIVNFGNGDVLDEDNLDTGQKQTLMAVQEVLDGRFATLTEDLDIGNFHLKRVANPEYPTDGANKQYVDASLATIIGANTTGVFIPKGVSAPVSTVQKRLEQTINVADYGTDAAPSYAAAFAALPAYGGSVLAPIGYTRRLSGLTPKTSIEYVGGDMMPINMFQDNAAQDHIYGHRVLHGALPGSHPNDLYMLSHIQMTADGSGGNNYTGSGDYALSVAAMKKNWPTTTVNGEVGGIMISVRNGGTISPTGNSDAAGLIYNVAGMKGAGYNVGIEGNTYELAAGTYAITRGIGASIGVASDKDGTSIGVLTNAIKGVSDTAIQVMANSATDYFSDILRNVVNPSGSPFINFKIGRDGSIIWSPSAGNTMVLANGSGALWAINDANQPVLKIKQDRVCISKSYIPTSSASAGEDGDVAINGNILYWHSAGQWWRSVGTSF